MYWNFVKISVLRPRSNLDKTLVLPVPVKYM